MEGRMFKKLVNGAHFPTEGMVGTKLCGRSVPSVS